MAKRDADWMDNEAIDLRGLKCPLPALFARRAVERAPAGATIEIVADDPMARIDVPRMCGQEGYEVVTVAQEGGTVRIRLRRPISCVAAEVAPQVDPGAG